MGQLKKKLGVGKRKKSITTNKLDQMEIVLGKNQVK